MQKNQRGFGVKRKKGTVVKTGIVLSKGKDDVLGYSLSRWSLAISAGVKL